MNLVPVMELEQGRDEYLWRQEEFIDFKYADNTVYHTQPLLKVLGFKAEFSEVLSVL